MVTMMKHWIIIIMLVGFLPIMNTALHSHVAILQNLMHEQI